MMEPAQRCHVLLIGIDRYEDAPLQGCVNDIDAFESFLQGALNMPPESITKLVAPHVERAGAEPPTRERILTALRTLAGPAVSPGEPVIIYYAGHGTRRYFAQAEGNYEAIIPVDYGGDPRRLLFDFELAPLLCAIARRSQDLTVILDCCNSAGVTRELDPLNDGAAAPRSRLRYMPDRDRPELPLPTPPTEAAAGRWLDGAELLSQCSILAAAQADETAAEMAVDPQTGATHGALSFALLELLRGPFRERLKTLRWAELWTPLRARLRELGVMQHPELLGSLGRKVLGGSQAPFDSGLAVRALADGRFEIEGGELAGLGADALLAVYAPLHPPCFAPLGSKADKADRIGLLRVKHADSERAIAELAPEYTSMPPLPEGARGRLARLGSLGRLRVACEPRVSAWIPELLLRHAAEDGTQLLTADDKQGEAEVLIGEDEDGALYLGDAVYSTNPATPPGPLVTIAASHADSEAARRAKLGEALRAALWHYATYAVPLRLARLGQRQDSALQPGCVDFVAIDARDESALQAMLQDARRCKPLPQDAAGRYLVRSGDSFVLRVHNLSWSRLYVAIVHCDGAGRVSIVSPPQALAPSTGIFIWPDGIQVGVPFQLTFDDYPQTRTRSIERIFAFITQSPEVDLRWLTEPRSLHDVVDAALLDAPLERELPPEKTPLDWTVARIQIEVRRDV